jgi:galactokinase
MTFTTVQEAAVRAGKAAFGASWHPESWAHAPGRLELLGNHIDYNGGSVLAGAIDRSVATGIASTPHAAGIDVVFAQDAGTVIHLDPDALGDWRMEPGTQAAPADYLRGVIAALTARSLPVRTGVQLSIAGDVPIGFGMSSSAALCITNVLAMLDRPLSQRDTVLIAQEAEHRAGSPVGAMDQSASVAGDIILFDGETVTWQHLTPDLGNLVFAVAHSGVDHALSASSYPVRVAESREALGLIRQQIDPGLSSLAAITADQWQQIVSAGFLPPVLHRRVRHVVGEQDRVMQGVEAVAINDWATFGALMTESGHSSATDYEISHPVVEELVAALNAMPGVLGARMMGGGEGGPALALLDGRAATGVEAALNREFYTRHPVDSPGGAFQVCRFGPGASREFT